MISTSGFDDYTTIVESFQIKPNKKGGFSRVTGEKAKSKRNFRIFEDFQPDNDIGDILVEPIPVNHSLPGASAFIIHTPDGAIVYTGDLRFHGYAGILTQKICGEGGRRSATRTFV
jgi:ribonuclease J